MVALRDGKDTVSGLSKLTILIIDDNAQMRSIIGAILGGLGIDKRHYATDGKTGLQAVWSVKPDIVFCDHEMPRMRGLEFLAALRALSEPLNMTPVIMLTGHSDMTRLAAARDLGVNEFLTKPVTADSIAKRINAVILNPRPFVRVGEYFGPDRRRRADPSRTPRARRAGDRPTEG